MVRLQINVSDQVAEQITTYADEIGISRNAMCAVLLYEGICSKNSLSEVADEIKKKLADISVGDRRGNKAQDVLSDMLQNNKA